MGQASKLFSGNTDQTLIGRVTPTAEQREFLQLQWNNLADHLKPALAKHGYAVSTWLQGSYKYATLIKPVRPREEYDVDVGVYFEWDDDQDAEPTPRQLRDWVQAELLAHEKACEELKKVEVPPKERCSRASYIRQFHIDTPVYHLNTDSDVRRLACLSSKWEHSDPKKLYKWFKEAVSGDDRDHLRRLVRYLKAWAAVSFDDAPDSRPSSIFLTVVATEAYQNLWAQRLLGMVDDDALLAVIKKMHTRLPGCTGADIWISRESFAIPARALDADVRLTHYRLQRVGELQLNLEAGEVVKLKGGSETGTGAAPEDERKALREIVQSMNDLFAGNITENDMVGAATAWSGRLRRLSSSLRACA